MQLFTKWVLIFILGMSSAPLWAHEMIFSLDLNGPNEALPNESPGTGSGVITFDLDLITMTVNLSFADLTGETSASHLHCCTTMPETGTASVATILPSFTDFPLGVISGTYSHTFDLTLSDNYNPAFIAANGGTVDGAFSALLQGSLAGDAYLNIHTATFPGGEIRGFLQPVPLPSAFWLMLAGLVGLKKRLLPVYRYR